MLLLYGYCAEQSVDVLLRKTSSAHAQDGANTRADLLYEGVSIPTDWIGRQELPAAAGPCLVFDRVSRRESSERPIETDVERWARVMRGARNHGTRRYGPRRPLSDEVNLATH